jgi:hypothetical protein
MNRKNFNRFMFQEKFSDPTCIGNPRKLFIFLRHFLIKFSLFSSAIFAGKLGLAATTPSLGSSLDPSSGHDPWALFQILIGVGSEIWYVIKLALLIAGLIGIVFIILGLLKIRSHALDSQSAGSHLKHGIILVILGGLLFGAPVLTMLTGYSLFGSSPAPVVTEAEVYCQVVNGQYNDNGGCMPVAPTPATLNCGPGQVLVASGCQPCQVNDYSTSSTSCPCGSDKFSGVISPEINYPNCPANPSCAQGLWDGTNCWYGPVPNTGPNGQVVLSYSGGSFFQACPSNINIPDSDPIPQSDFEEIDTQQYLFKSPEEKTAFLNLKAEVYPVCIWNN